MSAEEKILAMLEALQRGQAFMQADIQDLKANMSEVKARVVKMEITQENIIEPGLQLLAEGDEALAFRLKHLEELPDLVEDIQNSVSVLKHVFKEHAHS